jgi:hypothetical protein
MIPLRVLLAEHVEEERVDVVVEGLVVLFVTSGEEEKFARKRMEE